MGAWREVQTDPSSEAPPGRGGAACVAIGGRRILCFGGADRTPTAFGDWWLLELGEGSSGHWTKVSPVVKLSQKRKLLPRSGASLTYLPSPGGGPGKVYLFGGQEPVQGIFFDDLLCLDTGSWELTDVPLDQQQRRQRPPGRHSHVAGSYEQRGIVVFGGAGLRGPLSDVWLFDAAAGAWSCLSAGLAGQDLCPTAREMAAGTMISDAGLLVHGGRGAGGALLDDLCIFDGRAGRWVLVQPTGLPRCAHTASNVVVAAALEPHVVQLSAGAAAAAAGGGAVQQPTTSTDGGGSDSSAGNAAASGPAAAAAAVAAGGGGSGSDAGSGAAPVRPAAPAPASNVLLHGGFTGETVAADLLQLTFLRQQRSSGGHGLRAELRPVKAAAEAAPPPRFAHAAAVLSGPGSAELVVVGGVNQTHDLSDVHMWTV